MDRHRVDRTGGGGGSSDGGDRYSRFSSASFRNNNNHNDNDYPQRYPSSPPRGGGDGYMGGGGGGRYPSRNFPTGGGRNGGNGGVGGGGEGYGGYGGQLPYLSGQKRSSSEFSSPVRGGGGYYRRDSPPDSRWDSNDSGTFAKLFVGSVPRTATEDEVRPFFEQHGNVLEVALIKDKRTGQQQGCCFIKYATSKDADRAIRALHNQCTLPGGVAPIQVRYADGERERLGAVEYKLFVGSLNKHATEKEIEDIFAPYGLVEDVYIMRDEMKQSRGCGFVKYAHREMAAAAINALNGIYTMRGCDQPLIVRFADPKRPKTGDSRSGPTSGGPGFGPRSQMPPGPPPMSRPPVGRQMGSQAPSHLWPPMSPERLGPPSSLASQRLAAGPLPPSMAGSFGLGLSGAGQSNNGSLTGPGIMPISSSQQGFNLPLLQSQPYGLQPFQYTRSLQSPPHSTSSSQLPHSLASYTQGLPTLAPIPQASLALQSSSVSYPQTSPALAPKTQVIQPLQGSLTSNQLLGRRPPLQQLPGLNAQSPMPQMQMPLVGLTPGSQLSSGSQLQVGSLSFNQPQIPSVNSQAQQIQVQQPQLLVQQASSLGLQSQTVLSQLQQQLHLVQASSQSHQPPTSQPNVQQSLWAISMPQATLSSASIASIPVASSSVATASVPSLSSQPSSPASCSWTEHTSPEGYKYYYNSLSCESRWEKPEELTMFEQKQSQQQQPQQQPPPQQQQQAPQQLQAQSQAHLPVQLQQLQSQSQQHQPLQMKFQQPALSSQFQASGMLGQSKTQGASYLHLQALGTGVGASAAAAAIDPLRLQPSVAAQEWAWKK